jgi:hypothetical protein
MGPGDSSRRGGVESEAGVRSARGRGPDVGWVIETVVSPFHCLYQDALELHTQSRLRLAHSEAEASRLARAAFLLYWSAAESLVHQAAAELGCPDLAELLTDPTRPQPLAACWKLLPAVAGEGPAGAFDPAAPPWPQFAEVLALRESWSYPGPAERRRAYYVSSPGGTDYEPLQPHQVPAGVRIPADRLPFPRTGLPRDPYALRPHHLDTVRSVLDAAIQALDRRLGGALTRDARHRKEPVRVVHPPPGNNGA